MTASNSPHDRFFKAVFGRTEVAAEFLERYLPTTAAQALNWKTLRAAKDSFLDPELALHPADLLYAVDLRDGGPGYVHVLFEHKSYVESRIGLDLLRYRVRIWEQWLNAGNSGRLPVVVPVVVYHGAATWRVSRQFADEVEDAPALRAYVPACVYHLIDLSDYRDDELRGAVMLQTALLTLKYIFRDELSERLPEILGLLRDLAQSSKGLDYVRTLLRYLAQAASIDRLSGDQLRQAVTQTLSGGDELMLTIAEQWEQQATERGIEKGIEQGEARLLKQLLTWRFGSLPAWAEARLAGAEPARLETWAKRVLDAQTLDAVFGEGNSGTV
ncbi:Rpn family recombination-promoting nuclease/putative transposase [Accumulibacter sp.]|uniref:Rpn family recombination-promoting nuclease/putative transposase n=1 Tax=Accumulibacter sp. TaxID=2053492 RepID=UPI001A37A0C9|nr:Rpn family recombination-promoting nuclease/putative transposase [Accumulibacter sp.]MBL8374174.1 Rpn family recombination-promoting nuclease/putative transposase [Accumulibacter sp.]